MQRKAPHTGRGKASALELAPITTTVHEHNHYRDASWLTRHASCLVGNHAGSTLVSSAPEHKR